ncbi:MAG: YihY family inner membrane protein [Gemmatimonadota bacterium]
MALTVIARARAFVVDTLRALLRVDQWQRRFGPQLQRARDVLRFALRRAYDVRLAQVAGGLTFTTVLSLVPLLAVALSLFTAFPLFAEFRVSLEKDLLRGLLPEQYAPLILRYLNDFASKAGRLTAFGLIFLVFTALSMILTVDRIFNDIWRVQRRRPLVQRVLLYWSLLTLGPIVIGASLSATSYVMSMSAGWTTQLPAALRAVLELTPFVLGVSAVAATYVVVPNRKVMWRDAAVGALVAAVMGELMRDGFAWYIKAGTVANIYGAFAVLPLFLMWVYLSWLVILFGAAIAATAPMLRATRFADEVRAGNSFITAVALLRALHDARSRGDNDGRIPLATLARAVRTAPDEAERLLMALEELGYVSRLGGTQAGAWLLTGDPARLNLVAAFRRFAVDPANSLAAGDAEGIGAWMDEGMSADWIARPLSEIWRRP